MPTSTSPFPARHPQRRWGLRALWCALWGATLATALCPAAHADGDKMASATPLLPAYRQECAACHVAYPPGLLPAASWQRLMSTLPRHFGSDASLDPTLQRDITTWLAAHASPRAAEAPPEDRITRSAWFVREHREVAAATFKRASVKSASNCAACHTQADQGSYRERDIAIPR